MKEKRFVKLWSENIPSENGFQNKLILEIFGMESGVAYGRALWINGCFQWSNGISDETAFRLAKRVQKKNQL